MTEQPLQFDDLSPLLAALCDGTLDGDGFARLERWLATDPTARRWYIAYMDLHGDLCWDHRRSEGREEREERRGLCTSVPGRMPGEVDSGEGSGFRVQGSDSANHPSSPLPPIIIQTLPSPLSPLPSFLGSALFSYLIATLLMGVGLLAAWAWKLPNDTQLVKSPLPTPAEVIQRKSEPQMTFVGRITGMVDCQWSVVSGQNPLATIH
jgi:hypothetical protein